MIVWLKQASQQARFTNPGAAPEVLGGLVKYEEQEETEETDVPYQMSQDETGSVRHLSPNYLNNWL